MIERLHHSANCGQLERGRMADRGLPYFLRVTYHVVTFVFSEAKPLRAEAHRETHPPLLSGPIMHASAVSNGSERDRGAMIVD